MGFVLRTILSKSLHILLVLLFISNSNIFAGTTDSASIKQILNFTYHSNPITKKTIHFADGKYTERLNNGGKELRISIDRITNIDSISGCRFPCTAIIISADSGNGDVKSYLVALGKTGDKLTPVADLYLGNNITISKFELDLGCIELWMYYSFIGEDAKHPQHGAFRSFQLSGSKFIDYEFEKSCAKKNAIINDTVFTNSKETGEWIVKWNNTRAIAYPYFDGDTIEIYNEVFADINDIDFIAPDTSKSNFYIPTAKVKMSGDTIVVLETRPKVNRYGGMEQSVDTLVSPYWQYSKKYEMLSIVGPYVSFIETFIKDENSKPEYSIKVLRLSGDVDWYSGFTGAITKRAKTDEDGELVDDFTELYTLDLLMNELLKIPAIRAAYKDTLPLCFSWFYENDKVRKVIDPRELISRFYFTRIIGLDTLCLGYGLPDKTGKYIQEVKLPIPMSLRAMFLKAKETHGTTDYINPEFLANGIPRSSMISGSGRDTLTNRNQLSRREQKLLLMHIKNGQQKDKYFGRNEAIDQYTMALQIFPNDIPSLLSRASLELDHQNDAALADCNKILSLETHNASALYIRADIYTTNKLYHEALSDIDSALALDSAHQINKLWNLRGFVHKEMGDSLKASADYSMAIYYDRTDVSSLGMRGRIYKSLGQYKAACDDFEQCMQLWPDNHNFVAWAAYCYLELMKYDKAIEYFKRFAKANTKDFDVYLGLAEAYYYKNNLDSALSHLEIAISKQPILRTGISALSILEKQGYAYFPTERKALEALFEKRKNNSKVIRPK